MQAGTVGDYYSFDAFETDGVTPLNLTGYTSVSLAVTDPLGNNVIYAPTVLYTANVSTVFYFTTVATMFPMGGTFKLEFIIYYGGGAISKTRVTTVFISPSLI